MSITAIVENDTIKLPPGLHLPDGTEVCIETKPPAGRSVAESYVTLAGAAEDMPADAHPRRHQGRGGAGAGAQAREAGVGGRCCATSCRQQLRALGDCIRRAQPIPCAPPMQSPFQTDEKTLARRELQIERKQLSIEMRENFRGRFLRIVEKCGGKTNVVIIPDTGINDFFAAFDEVIAETNTHAHSTGES